VGGRVDSGGVAVTPLQGKADENQGCDYNEVEKKVFISQVYI